MVRQGRVGGEDGEALGVGAEVLDEVVQSQIGAVVPPRDPELVGEAAQEVQAVQLGRAPQDAVAQVGRAQCGGIGQRVGRADQHVDGFQPHQTLGQSRIPSVGQRVYAAESQVRVTAQQRLRD